MKYFENMFFMVFFGVILTSEIWMARIFVNAHKLPSLIEMLVVVSLLVTITLITLLLVKRFKGKQPKSYYHKVWR